MPQVGNHLNGGESSALLGQRNAVVSQNQVLVKEIQNLNSKVSLLENNANALHQGQVLNRLVDLSHSELSRSPWLLPSATPLTLRPQPETQLTPFPHGSFSINQLKVPVVQPITKNWLKENVGNANNIRIQLKLILGQVALLPQMDKELAIANFVTDSEARNFVSTFFAQLKSGEKQFEEDAFITAFLQSVNSDVRPLSVIALHDILGGKVTQGASSVAKYNESFYQRARLLPNETQESLCLHYLSGLKPELGTLCCLDRDNKRWTSLHDLVTFTLAEEERLNLTKSFALKTTSMHSLAVVTPKMRVRRNWKHKGKLMGN
jgi:hypothetical protein